jgi:hypothetical protein
MSRTQAGFTGLVLLAFLSLCFLHVFEATSQPAPPAPLPPSPMEQALKTAKLDKEKSSGTCFPVAVRDGMVAWLSNRHVVEDRFWRPEAKAVELANGDRLPVRLVVLHPSLDLALVWTAMNPQQPIVPIPLAPADAVTGDFALLAGYPGDAGLWISAGFVASASGDGQRWSSVPIFYGCSGGPVLVNGYVVGVARAIHVDAEHGPVPTISAFVPVGSFRDWLTRVTTAGANLK